MTEWIATSSAVAGIICAVWMSYKYGTSKNGYVKRSEYHLCRNDLRGKFDHQMVVLSEVKEDVAFIKGKLS